jgi:hypothetical protein
VLPRPVTGDGEQGVIFHAQRIIVNSNTDDLGTFGLDLGPMSISSSATPVSSMRLSLLELQVMQKPTTSVCWSV